MEIRLGRKEDSVLVSLHLLRGTLEKLWKECLWKQYFGFD